MAAILNILLADADGLTRRVLRRSLNEDLRIHVCAEAHNVADCVRHAESAPVDVVVVREKRPQLDALLLSRSLLARGFDRLVCVAAGSEPVYLRHLISLGVRGLLDAGCDMPELRRAICRVGEGCSFVSAAVATQLVGQAGAGSPLERLSKREIQVLSLISGGLRGAEIGHRLGLSPKTVSTYRSRICAKLDLPRPTDLPDLARRLTLSTASAE